MVCKLELSVKLSFAIYHECIQNLIQIGMENKSAIIEQSMVISHRNAKIDIVHQKCSHVTDVIGSLVVYTNQRIIGEEALISENIDLDT